MSSVVDTVILVDQLNDIAPAAALFTGPEEVSASLISWIEVMVGAATAEARAAAEDLFTIVTIVGITEPIAEEAVRIRRERRLKLPDAIILATARHLGVPLITRNTKDFDPADPMIRVPYTV